VQVLSPTRKSIVLIKHKTTKEHKQKKYNLTRTKAINYFQATMKFETDCGTEWRGKLQGGEYNNCAKLTTSAAVDCAIEAMTD